MREACVRSGFSGVGQRLATVVLLSLLFGFCLSSVEATAEDWPKYRRDLSNTGASAETGISSRNVKSLKIAWTFPTGGQISAEPAVATINGVSTVFLGSTTGFYALNAVTGGLIWSYSIDLVGQCNPTKGCRIGSSAYVDAANNLVLFGARNAYVYALNATTGALVWKQQTGDPQSYEVWASPAVYNGMVYVGTASHGDAPCLEGGEVNAYDELTGSPVWSFNTIDQSTCPGGGDCVGGAVWSSVAIDTTNGIVYAGTGNPGSTCHPPTQNAGLYPDSVLALDATTGQLLNYYQAVKDDNQDLDFGSSPVLHTASETNQCTGVTTTTNWVSEASKNGHVYTLGRDASGLNGMVYDNQVSNPTIIASPGLLSARQTKPCDATKKIVDVTNYIAVPSATNGSLYVLFQDGTGATSLSFSKLISQSMPIYSAPTLIQDIAIFGGNDGYLHVLAKTGKLLGKVSFGSAAIYGSVAISNSRVYFGSSDGTIYCLSLNGR